MKNVECRYAECHYAECHCAALVITLAYLDAVLSDIGLKSNA